jgi:hypothetical protein
LLVAVLSLFITTGAGGERDAASSGALDADSTRVGASVSQSSQGWMFHQQRKADGFNCSEYEQ